MNEYIWLIVIVMLFFGFISGIFAGLLGLGGGIIFTPILLYVLQMEQVDHPIQDAIITSLFCITFASIRAAWGEKSYKNINKWELVYTAFGGILGVVIGHWCIQQKFFTTEFFVFIYTLLLLFCISMNVFSKTKLSQEHATYNVLVPWKSILIGFCGGIISLLGGVGGGMIILILYHWILKKEIRQSVFLSLFCMIIISISGWLPWFFISANENLIIPKIHFEWAFIFIISSWIGCKWGILWGKKLSPIQLRWIFVIIMSAITLNMWLNIL